MPDHPKKSGFSVVLISQLAIVLLAVVFVHWLDVRLLNPRVNSYAAVAIGTVLAVFTYAAFVMIYHFGGGFAQQLLNDIRRVSVIFSGYSWAHFSVIAALAGVGEELLFRAFMQEYLHGFIGIFWAIALTSLLFGALHYLSAAYFVSTLVMSVLFGVGYYYSGSLLMVVVWHGIYDFIALVTLIKWPQFFVNSSDRE